MGGRIRCPRLKLVTLREQLLVTEFLCEKNELFVETTVNQPFCSIN